jgi:hypothetical protein
MVTAYDQTPLARRVFTPLDCESPGIVSSAAAVLGNWLFQGTTYRLYPTQGVERALGQGVASIRTPWRETTVGIDTCWS